MTESEITHDEGTVTFREYVEHRLAQLGLSYRKLAYRTELSPNTISEVVRLTDSGERKPKVETIDTIADALHVDKYRLRSLAGIDMPAADNDLPDEDVYIARQISQLPAGVRQQARGIVVRLVETMHESVEAGATRAAAEYIKEQHPAVWQEAVNQLRAERAERERDTANDHGASDRHALAS